MTIADVIKGARVAPEVIEDLKSTLAGFRGEKTKPLSSADASVLTVKAANAPAGFAEGLQKLLNADVSAQTLFAFFEAWANKAGVTEQIQKGGNAYEMLGKAARTGRIDRIKLLTLTQSAAGAQTEKADVSTGSPILDFIRKTSRVPSG